MQHRILTAPDFDNSKVAHWYGISELELEAKPQYLELQAF